MKISVIIPTYNEEKVIGDCLESLSKQTCKDLEFIVVDDGSADATALEIRNSKFEMTRVARNSSLKRTIRNLLLLKQKHKGPGAARNLGVKHAKGEILVFVDSDMTFEKDFIEKLVEPIKSGLAKGTWSRDEYVANPDNVWSKCWGINEGWEEGKRHPKNYPAEQRVFRAILKSEFDRVGGFSLTGYTDDWTLSEKLGYKAVCVEGARFYHSNPGTLAEVFAQARWIGKRRYKYGLIGKIVAIVRASLPVSISVGGLKSVVYRQPGFLVFKVVYDLGVFIGSSTSILGGSTAK